MALVVENGSGLANANGYVSVVELKTYANDRGAWPASPTPFEDPQLEQAIVRATAYIDAAYRGDFSGYRVKQRNQALEWPRQGAYAYTPDKGYAYEGYGYGSGYYQPYEYLSSTAVPPEIKNATCEAALKELAKPGVLSPDLRRSSGVKSVTTDGVTLEFTQGMQAVFQSVENALSSLLAERSMYTARASRA